LRIPKFHTEIFDQISMLRDTELKLYVDILKHLSFDLEWISLVLSNNAHLRENRRIQKLGHDWIPPIFGYLQLDYHNYMDFSIEIKVI
jgi:hypothetical protein